MPHYDFIDDDGNILLWRLGSSRGLPDDPRYIPAEIVEALFRLKIAQIKQPSERNVAALKDAAAGKAAQKPHEGKESGAPRSAR